MDPIKHPLGCHFVFVSIPLQSHLPSLLIGLLTYYIIRNIIGFPSFNNSPCYNCKGNLRVYQMMRRNLQDAHCKSCWQSFKYNQNQAVNEFTCQWMGDHLSCLSCIFPKFSHVNLKYIWHAALPVSHVGALLESLQKSMLYYQFVKGDKRHINIHPLLDKCLT